MENYAMEQQPDIGEDSRQKNGTEGLLGTTRQRTGTATLAFALILFAAGLFLLLFEFHFRKF